MTRDVRVFSSLMQLLFSCFSCLLQSCSVIRGVSRYQLCLVDRSSLVSRFVVVIPV